MIYSRQEPMKLNRSLAGAIAVCGVAAVMAASASAAWAQAGGGSARVLHLVGNAQYSTDGAKTWQPLKVGDVVAPGAVVQTASGSSMDLVLANKEESLLQQVNPTPSMTFRPQGEATADVIRMYENTVLGVDKLTFTQTGADVVTETQLDLRRGKIFGSVKKMSGASRYEVKYPTGVASIRGTVFILYYTGVLSVYSGNITESPTSGAPPVTVGAGYEYDPSSGKMSQMSSGTPDYDELVMAIKQIGVLPPGAPPNTFAPDVSTKWVSPVIGAQFGTPVEEGSQAR